MLKTPEQSIFDEVNLFFDDSADRLDLNDGLREMLRRPWRELLVQVPVRWMTARYRCSAPPECSITPPAAPTKAGSATIRKPTSKRCGPWTRS